MLIWLTALPRGVKLAALAVAVMGAAYLFGDCAGRRHAGVSALDERADSLQRVAAAAKVTTALAVQRAAAESVAAAAALRHADSARAEATIAAESAAVLRRRLQRVGRDSVRVRDSTVAIPSEVGEQLTADSVAIARLQATVVSDTAALARVWAYAAAEHVARTAAEERAAALEQVNATLRAQVKSARPWCRGTCGFVLGAAAAGGAVWLARR